MQLGHVALSCQQRGDKTPEIVPGQPMENLMRCLACGAEMKLVNVVVDDSMIVPGFERQTFMCSGCNDIERRFVFSKIGKQHSAAASPPIAPTSETIEDDADIAPSSLATGSVENEQFPATQSLWKRILLKLRRWWSRSNG
jgi:hypothetical protein